MADNPTSWGEGKQESGWHYADAHRDANRLFNNTGSAVPNETPPILAVTATRKGLTLPQERTFVSVIRCAICDPFVFHHGAAVGGDCDLTRLAVAMRQLGRTIRIVAWPSNLASQQAASALAVSDEVKPAAPPLERNLNMIANADMVMAFPAGFHEEVRSGTWATVRAAERNSIPVTMIWPDGSICWSNSWGNRLVGQHSESGHFFNFAAVDPAASDKALLPPERQKSDL